MISILKLWLLTVCFFLAPVRAAEFTVPKIEGHVTDNVGVLSRNTRQSLETLLADVKIKSDVEMAILVIPSLEGFTIEEASIKVAEAWKLGTSKDDKGLLLLISVDERKLRFEVGQGLEGDLTDLESARIIRNTMVPLLRAGQFDEAVWQGTLAALQKAAPDLKLSETSPPGVAKYKKNLNTLSFLFWFFLFLIFPFLGRRRRGRRRSGVLDTTFWGSGSGGGFGGGGFGGGFGGGGGFSGGGASGGW